MGLFNKQSTGRTLRDVFSDEELRQITDVLGPKLEGGQYGALPQLMAKGMMDYVSRPDQPLNPGKLKSFSKIAVSLQEMEPSLQPILQAGVARINTMV